MCPHAPQSCANTLECSAPLNTIALGRRYAGFARRYELRRYILDTAARLASSRMATRAAKCILCTVRSVSIVDLDDST